MQHSSAAQVCENRMVKQHLHHSAYLHFTVQHAHTHTLTHKLQHAAAEPGNRMVFGCVYLETATSVYLPVYATNEGE